LDRQGLVPALLSEVALTKAVFCAVRSPPVGEKRSMNFEKEFANHCAVKNKEEEGSNHFGL